MKKKIISMIASVMMLSVLVVGCGSKDASGNAVKTGTEAAQTELSKAQWIGMLGDCFGYTEAFEESEYFSDVKADQTYYNEIQACAEWGIMTESGTFKPEQPVTWSYVLETSVRAIGLENINTSTAGVTVTEEGLVDFFTGNIANINVSDMSAKPTKEQAIQALGYAYQYYLDLTPADCYKVIYNDGVYEVEADAVSLKGDGMTAIINDGTSYATGNIIYIKSSDQSAACALKVTSCDGNQIKYELAGMEDVFEEMTIRGSYDATIVDVDAAEYVSLRPSERAETAVLAANNYNVLSSEKKDSPIWMKTDSEASVKRVGNGVMFDIKKGQVNFTVSLTDFRTETDIDFGVLKGLKKANAEVRFNNEIKLEYKAEHYSATIPLGSITMQLGSTPLQAKVSLVANIGLDGAVTLTYTSTVVGKVQYAKGKGLSASVSNNSSSCDLHAEVTVTAEPTVKVDLKCFDRSIVNLKITSGAVAVATADTDILEGKPSCVDVYLFVPLRWAVNEDGCVMRSISNKLTKSQAVWNSENSPITKRFHWENKVLVEACTRDKDEQVETPETAEDGKPYEEYALFDFEEIVFGLIDVASIHVYLDRGETMAIGILSVPDGYSINDLVYTVQDSGICSAAGGNVTGTASGSTVLQISTPDGKYSVYLTVTVAAEYNDTSGFEPLDFIF